MVSKDRIISNQPRFIRVPIIVIFCIFAQVIAFASSLHANSGQIVDSRNDTVSIGRSKISKWIDNEEIQIFRDYLRIPTPHPNIDYKPCVAFLQKQAASLNLPVTISYPVDDNNPVVVMTWEGSQPELPSIMLNSHMDVVPVFEEYWIHPPFAADMDENGDIFARGAQDMKQVGMQYLAAIRSLKQQGIQRLKRTVYVVFVPDEELGSFHGTVGFVKTEQFTAMNVGFALDEGSIRLNDEGTLFAYYGERTIWNIEFIVRGQSGHGSRLFENSPGEKLSYLLNKITEFRKEEMKKLKDADNEYGNVTSINLTKLKGGVEINVVPPELSASFDIRIAVNVDLNEFEQKLKRWCDEAGGNITMKFLRRDQKEQLTTVDDSNPYWVAFKSAVDKIGLNVQPSILTGGSSSKYLRRLNISAIGFSPLINTVPKLHDHNEYINAETYIAGIEIYKHIIPTMANL